MDDEAALFDSLAGIASLLEQSQQQQIKFQEKLLDLMGSIQLEIQTLRTDVMELNTTLIGIEMNTGAVVPPPTDDD